METSKVKQNKTKQKKNYKSKFGTNTKIQATMTQISLTYSGGDG